MTRLVVHLNPDGVNGGVEFYGDVPEGLEILVCSGSDGDVVGSHGIPHKADVAEADEGFYPVCACGWEGLSYYELEAAAAMEADEHVEEVS